MSTYPATNPSFTVIELDEESLVSLNVKKYQLDITKADKDREPKWELIHDILDYYGMEDMSPDSFNDLAQRVKDDEELAIRYQWNKRG